MIDTGVARYKPLLIDRYYIIIDEKLKHLIEN